MNTVDIFVKPVVLQDSWDRHGHSFKELTDIQSDQLHRWATRLVTRVTYEVWAYLKSTNLPATDEKQVHRVYRGQDLVQIIMDWPDLKPCYVQPSKPGGMIEVTLTRSVEKDQLLTTADFADPRSDI